MKKSKTMMIAGALATVASGISAPASAGGPNPQIGEIMWVGFSFCPRGYASADGRLLSISSNAALFSLLGTIYGGDGRTTFALPDLRGRIPIHTGIGPGVGSHVQGEKYGTNTASLSASQMPSHTHSATTSDVTVKGSSANANTATADGNVLANGRVVRIFSTGGADVDMDASAVSATTTLGSAGNGAANGLEQPSLALNACVATQGTFPSRG